MISHRAWSFLVRPMIYVFVAISAIFTRCTFDTSGFPADVFPPVDVPLAEQLCRDLPVKVLEDPGKLIVYHGFSCAESNRDGEENILRLEERIQLPRYVTAATVYLNGWELQYLSKDHHVFALGSTIFDIEFRNGTLRWQAGGGLSDDNFDDGYRWQYYYTVIGWNELEIGALADHDDDPDKIFRNSNQDHTTALKKIAGFVHNSDFLSVYDVAILPRGFYFNWSPGDDHHLLQLAYNLDHSDRIVQSETDYMGGIQPALPDLTSQVGNGFVSWESKTIYKDNDLRRKYYAGEMVSALGGRDVGLIQPPFTILPTEDGGFFSGCFESEGGVKSEEYVVDNIPYEYAVPVLTGWNIRYPCDDEHVTKIGAWVDNFEYTKAPENPAGSLRYTISSVLVDKDNYPHHVFNHQVQIVGIKKVVGTGVPTAVINSPHSGVHVAPDSSITLFGEATDPEDGELTGSALSWHSDRDGFLGHGNSLTVTLSGPPEPCNPEFITHTITLRATDQDGNQTSRQIIIRVGFIC